MIQTAGCLAIYRKAYNNSRWRKERASKMNKIEQTSLSEETPEVTDFDKV